jgi:transcriptional regulator with XRE-family HTH domain
MTIFGDFLREVREERGMTLEELARKVGVSASMLSRLENGKRGIPRDSLLLKIADALGIDDKVLGLVILESVEEERRKSEPSPPAIENLMEFVDDAAGVARVPVLHDITAENALLCAEHIVGSRLLPVDKIGDAYFYFQASDDSMKGAGIEPGNHVLIRVNDTPELNKICLVLPKGESKAMLRQVSYSSIQRMLILHTASINTPPILIPRFGWRRHLKVYGTAVRVERSL